MNRLTILRGCDGAGKSWYATQFEGAVLFSSRNYEKDAATKCYQVFCKALVKLHTHMILIDSNLYSHNWGNYATLAEKNGYEVKIVTIIPESPEKAFLRQRYNVPFSEVYRAYHESLVHPMSMENHSYYYETERFNASRYAPTD